MLESADFSRRQHGGGLQKFSNSLVHERKSSPKLQVFNTALLSATLRAAQTTERNKELLNEINEWIKQKKNTTSKRYRAVLEIKKHLDEVMKSDDDDGRLTRSSP